MPDNEEVTDWLKRLGNGDELACERIWQEYFGKLAGLARRKLGGLPLRSIDEEDIALSAMNSFFAGMQKHRFDALKGRDDLWKLLVTITARKATAKKRLHFAQKRGGGRIRGESVFIPEGGEEARHPGIGDVLGKEPTPELALDLAENCQTLLDQLDDETLKKIAVLTLEGHGPEEIAEKIGCARRTVERKLQRIREIWSDSMP